MTDKSPFPPLTENQKLDLIRGAIQTEEGWKNLALAVKSADTKEQCIEMLRKVAGTREIDMPYVEGTGPVDNYDPTKTYQTMKVPFAEVLISQLEYHLAQLETQDK